MKRNYVISEDLMLRLVTSARSGDPIAKWIVTRFRNPNRDEVFGARGNYFTCDVDLGSGVRQVRVRYSSMENSPVLAGELKMNPEAPYMKARSTQCSLSKFLLMFKDFPQDLMADSAVEGFGEIMKVGQTVYTMLSDKYYDFKRAYNYSNYAQDPHIDQSPLHNSCMRHDSMNEVVADFYKHVGHCKILIAHNEGGQVMGRAIVWPNVTIRIGDDEFLHGSLMSRMYFTCVAVRDVMLRDAKNMYGINFRMKQQSLHCHRSIHVMNSTSECSGMTDKDLEIRGMEARLYPSPRFNGGIPYVDAYEFVRADADGLYLSNDNDASDYHCEDRCLSTCATTAGCISSSTRLCPLCGKYFEPNSTDTYFCDTCRTARRFDIGNGICVKKVVDVPGYGRVPVECTHRGVLKPDAAKAILINRMQKDMCR